MKIEDVFYKLRPIRGRQLDLLWQEYLVAEPPLRKTIEKVLRVQLARQLGETFESEQVLLKPPPSVLAVGEYHVGTIHYGKSSYYGFGLREDEFIQHIGIFGRSGSGKTNLAFLILRGLVKAGKPFLVFDWKRNYRDLLTRAELSDMMIFTVGRDVVSFRFNPLMPPPGTPATVWLKKLIEVMCHAYFLGEGVSVLLMRAIDALYKEYGLYTQKLKGYPTMAHVRQWLGDYGAKGREAGWMESAVRAVETLCFGEVGKVLNHGPFFDVTRLLDKRVVLELDALTNADKTFLIESLLLWIHHYRMGQKDREAFKHGIIIEEAHHILLRKKQEVTGEETVTDIILREIRELGEAVICLDQHPSLISKPALGNTYTTFAFNLKHRGDLGMMQDCLLLDKEQTEYLGRLEVGWAVVKLQGRWFWPFLVKLPMMKLEKGAITDARLRQIARENRKEFSCLLSPVERFSSMISTHERFSNLQEGSKAGISLIPLSEKRNNKKGKKRCTIKLTTQEKDFLKDVWEHATSNITQRYSRLSLSVRFGNKIQNSLFSMGFIFSFNVCFGKGRMKALSLTERGKKALGINDGESNRHGGPEHRFAQEVPAGSGKTIDIVASRGGERIAFEIETGKSDAVDNVSKCLDAGLNKVIVVATSAPVRDKLFKALPTDAKVEILTASELLSRQN
jgi:hypothetical protein